MIPVAAFPIVSRTTGPTSSVFPGRLLGTGMFSGLLLLTGPVMPPVVMFKILDEMRLG
jgi:hypothetical protein